MHEFDYLKRKKDKEFVQDQLQIEVPPLVRQQAEEKKEDCREERSVVVIDIWK